MMDTDKIEKRVFLRASQARVFRALTDSAEFGRWFRAEFAGPFVAGEQVYGRITHPGYEHLTMTLWIERIEPEHYFAFRWHPYAIDPAHDYSDEPSTLVEFTLAPADGGVSLTIVESGFDRLPAARRDEAFRMNEGGWAAQLENIAAHVAGA